MSFFGGSGSFFTAAGYDTGRARPCRAAESSVLARRIESLFEGRVDPQAMSNESGPGLGCLVEATGSHAGEDSKVVPAADARVVTPFNIPGGNLGKLKGVAGREDRRRPVDTLRVS